MIEFKNLRRQLWGPGRSLASQSTSTNLVTASYPWKSPRFMGRVMGGVTLAAVGTGLAMTGMKAVTNMGNSFMRGIAPSSAYPVASGRYGIRTAEGASPAGIAGLKFNFRRRN